MRKVFIKELTRLNKKKKNIYLVINDLGYNVVEPFRENYPKHFLNAGVSEQNMMGMSAGIASEQCHTFVYSIANFSTFRCAEQIRNDVDYHNLPVTIVSVGSGLGYGNLGYSHHALQDYSLMRSFPNMLILSPGNNDELTSSLKFIVKNPQPSYLRLDKDESIQDNQNKYLKIEPGKPIKILDGSKKNVIIVTGKMQSVAQNLVKKKYRGYSIYSLPIWGMKTKKKFFNSINKFSNIITIEDHFHDGGFGSWVGEILKTYKNNINIKSKYIMPESIYEVGSKNYLLKKYGPK
ncbi:transketolase [bacterium]|nr:transketolase [bacterium]